jgi:hypothetical protein
MSTKNVLGRPWVEFVLGIDQVIKGFDRALPMMSVGERSLITVTPEYGCKDHQILDSYCGFLCVACAGSALYPSTKGSIYQATNTVI